MNSIYSHPNLTNDFQRELAIASGKATAANPKADPAFRWLIENNANALLFKALAQCTHFRPTPGVEKKPSHWTSPPPGGPDQCVVIVMGRDSKGTLRACASNSIAKPVKTDEACPPKFFDHFDTLRSRTAQLALIHQAVSSVASKDHLARVDEVFKEGQRFRTSPVILIILEGDNPHFHATTALIEGPNQIDLALAFTGSVKP